ncbi:RES domain-containing protein [Elizabethkingia anophelis]|nr:RES domain-containing protein [Elizabethkingia anophelis]
MENNTEILKQKIQFLRNFLKPDSIKEKEIELLKHFFLDFSFITGLTYKTKIEKFQRVTINSRIFGEEKRITEINHLENPPELYVKRFGRANMIGQSVLYATDNPLTALAEMRPEAGQLITISKWKLITDYDLTVYSIFKNSPLTTDVSNLMTIKAQIEYSKLISKINYPKELLDQIDLLIQFICDCFSKEVNDLNHFDYFLSAHYANQIFTTLQNGEIDAILYPSVRQSLELTNIAMKPAVFKANYVLESVEESKLVRFSNNGWQLEGTGDSKKFENGNILWL